MFKPSITVVLLMILAACAGEASDGTTPQTTTTGKAVTSTTTTSTPAETSAPSRGITTAPPTSSTTTSPPEPTPESITVSGGDVSGPEMIEVQLGSEAVFTVTADVVDEVHVHGYDLTFDLEPGVPTEVRFLADVPGVFEIELEAAHQPLVELSVVP